MAISEKLNQMSGRIAGTGSIEEALAVLAMNGGGSSGEEYVVEFTVSNVESVDPVVTCSLSAKELYDGVIDGSIKKAFVNFVQDSGHIQSYSTMISTSCDMGTDECKTVIGVYVIATETPMTPVYIVASYMEPYNDRFWLLASDDVGTGEEPEPVDPSLEVGEAT